MARTPSKPHIPYRGDDPNVGKKTGIPVPRSILRTSDGYEPFNDVLSQAVTPPPRRKKKRVSEVEEEEEDEFGEASMDVDSEFIFIKRRLTERVYQVQSITARPHAPPPRRVQLHATFRLISTQYPPRARASLLDARDRRV